MKYVILLLVLTFLMLPIYLVDSVSKVRYIRLFKCPSKTIAYKNSIIFAGNLSNLGNDKLTKVYFEYGRSKDLGIRTPIYTLKNPGIFCIKVINLTPCTTYYYRAVAQNSAGTNYGEIKEIKTKCK